MDKLDQQITEAKKDYQPKTDFTDATMQKINAEQPSSKKTWFKPFAFSAAAAIPVLAIVFVFAGINNQPAKNTTTTTKPASTQTTTNVSNAKTQVASEFDTTISQLDNEVGNYAVSYPETSLDNLNQ